MTFDSRWDTRQPWQREELDTLLLSKLSKTKEKTTRELADVTGANMVQVRTRLTFLWDAGKVKAFGEKRFRTWTRA